MKNIIFWLTETEPSNRLFDISLLVFRIVASLELMVAHGLKKIGVSTTKPEIVPNPLDLPEELNRLLAISANLFFPILVILGFLTRLATLPVLAVTLTGYFVVHRNGTLLQRDTPLIYSLIFLLILVLGPGGYSVDSYLHNKTTP